MSGANIIEFQEMFLKLNDYPDKNIIDQLTYFAQSNRYNLAQEIVIAMSSRLSDSTIPPSYKLPIFYLMDSIMKYNREPYVPLFSEYLQRFDMQFYMQYSDQHRAKLEKLFGTWEERNLISLELLNKMRLSLTQAAYARTKAQPHLQTNTAMPSHQPSHYPQVPHPYQVSQSQAVYNQGSMESYPTQPYAQPYPSQPYPDQNQALNTHNSSYYPNPSMMYVPPPPADYAGTMPSNSNMTAAITSSHANVAYDNKNKRMREDRQLQPVTVNSSLFRSGKPKEAMKRADPRQLNKRNKTSSSSSSQQDDPVQAEMNNLLSQLLSDLGQTNSGLSLEELYHENMVLYQQLQSQAESIVASRNNNNQTSLNYSTIHDSAMMHTVIANDDNMQSSTVDPSLHYQYHHHNQSILGFVNETPVMIPYDRPAQLIHQLELTTSHMTAMLSPPAISYCNHLSSRLKSYVNRLSSSNQHHHSQSLPLPVIVTGALPHDPSARFMQRISPASVKHATMTMLEVPVFRPEDLTRRPGQALKALYTDRLYLAEDGQRFTNQTALREHTDKLITARIEKKKQQMKGESAMIVHRGWYATLSIWTKEENIKGHHKASSSSNRADVSAMDTNDAGEEYIVPADENFVRCPISKEAFEKFWDDKEGEYMYHNAVKLLITPAADERIYSLGRPMSSSSTSYDDVKYMIVRKPLIVDNWISSGAAMTLPLAIQHYRTGGKDEMFIQALTRIMEEEEDAADDIFVLLEPIHR